MDALVHGPGWAEGGWGTRIAHVSISGKLARAREMSGEGPSSPSQRGRAGPRKWERGKPALWQVFCLHQRARFSACGRQTPSSSPFEQDLHQQPSWGLLGLQPDTRSACWPLSSGTSGFLDWAASGSPSSLAFRKPLWGYQASIIV